MIQSTLPRKQQDRNKNWWTLKVYCLVTYQQYFLSNRKYWWQFWVQWPRYMVHFPVPMKWWCRWDHSSICFGRLVSSTTFLTEQWTVDHWVFKALTITNYFVSFPLCNHVKHSPVCGKIECYNTKGCSPLQYVLLGKCYTLIIRMLFHIQVLCIN